MQRVLFHLDDSNTFMEIEDKTEAIKSPISVISLLKKTVW